MPQLNPEFYLSQVFWLVITFFFLLFFLWKVSLPRIGLVLQKREKKIYDDIEEAKKLQTDAEMIQSKIDEQLNATRKQVVELIKETTNRLQSNVATQLQTIDIELTKKIDESAKTIDQNKNKILIDINSQIREITKLTLSKLTNIDVSEDEINTSIRNIQTKRIN